MMQRAPLRLGASTSHPSSLTMRAGASSSHQLMPRNSGKIGIASRSGFTSSSFPLPSSSLLLSVAGHRLLRPQQVFPTRSQIRRFATGKEKESPFKDGKDVGSAAPGKTRVEVNLSDSTDQVALGYLKKYGRKLAVDWPIQGLKYGALAALAVGTPPYIYYILNLFYFVLFNN
jgi:hypothetical protein